MSNSFGTVDYDAHTKTNIYYSINRVFKSITIHELNTLHQDCELERTQLLSIAAINVQNLELVGYHLSGNHRKYLYTESSIAWLKGCHQLLSPLFEVDRGFDGVPIYYQDTVIYIGPIITHTFNYATPKSCDNIPENVIAIAPDNYEHYVLTPKPVLRATPTHFEPKQDQIGNKLKQFHCTRN